MKIWVEERERESVCETIRWITRSIWCDLQLHQILFRLQPPLTTLPFLSFLNIHFLNNFLSFIFVRYCWHVPNTPHNEKIKIEFIHSLPGLYSHHLNQSVSCLFACFFFLGAHRGDPVSLWFSSPPLPLLGTVPAFRPSPPFYPAHASRSRLMLPPVWVISTGISSLFLFQLHPFFLPFSCPFSSFHLLHFLFLSFFFLSSCAIWWMLVSPIFNW